MYLVFEYTYDFPISLSIKRRPGETEEAAMTKRDEVADHLRVAFPHFDILAIPYYRFRAKQSTDIMITPPLMSFVGSDHLVNVLQAQTVDERVKIARDLEEAASEQLEQVDALGLVKWCLAPLSRRLPYSYNLTKANDETVARHYELEAKRLELLEPYFAGKFPIRLPQVFAEFWELPWEARKAIESADNFSMPISADHFGAEFRDDDNKLDLASLQLWWRDLAQELVAGSWLVPAKKIAPDSPFARSCAPQYAPILSKGPKAKLLKPRLMRL